MTSIRFASAFVVVMLQTIAASASPSAKIVYVRGAGADACPDEQVMRRAVAARLGYDPFFPAAQKTVVAQIMRTAAGFHGKVQLVGDDGRLLGERDLATTGDDCAELVTTVALAVSIALDDLDEEKRVPTPAPTLEAPAPSSPAPREPEEEVVPPSPKPVPRAPLELAASVGPTATVGAAPAIAAGGSVVAMLSYKAVGARFSLRGDLPASTALSPSGTLATRTTLVVLQGCARVGMPFACVGVGLGSLHSETSGISRPASDSGLFVVPVASVGSRLALGSAVYIEPFLDGTLGLAPQRIQVDGVRAYTVPPASGTVGIHLGARFL